MVFSSVSFLFVFLPLTLAGYYLMGKQGKNVWLLMVSLLFFGWSQGQYVWVILASIAINYCGAFMIGKFPRYRKMSLLLTVMFNLGLLYYFKYFDFTLDTVNRIFHLEIPLRQIVLPIGISFFTFQGISYVADVYSGRVKIQKNPFKVALYIVLFPQLIAGPIVRYQDIEREIDGRYATKSGGGAVCGIQRFILGLAKKVLVANSMAYVADSIWKSGPLRITCAVAWLGSIAYGLQIYFDFSGYSDMAIGLGRMFGFHFQENFRFPYISKSVSEFWRRWHISLSSWFRDYVYIPLGGNRKHVYRNLLIVFLLTGIWHGASWHYVLWGLWNGFFVLAERKFCGKRKSTSSDWIGRIYTLLVVNFGWVIFRAPDIMDGLRYIRTMLGMRVPDQIDFTFFWYFDRWSGFMMAAGILCATPIPEKIWNRIRSRWSPKIQAPLKIAILVVLFVFSALRIVSETYNPFIYFQF